ncbi:glycerol-3-phosphate dehydrogenase [NAD(+)], cytoplasmic-like [Argiope bruennichi]|uniref:Glycerol-3-phosphate dehydrogenase [NAD(+)] n=1 Tax=Argiope bruennichi TaxID=94029 RepID=A0A8T0DZY4_ARGBR|nr:glycerol-3-phosphate dehydrogenase [NAD(+)], cytoplasmic-like [Argiope bruennichi]KAF8764042.1 Glycerol-3-phosphate dehydrogenase [NAD(+)] like protein [Argiope bruennichi]
MKKVTIIGSGNWGTAIARIVASNVKNFEEFDNTVNMYVFEEMIDGRKLSEIINTEHENVKYLPGFKIPDNVVAVPDPVEAARDADILVWVLPHKFVRGAAAPMVGKIKPNAVALSLIKGFDIIPGGGIALISDVLRDMLNIEVSVMMGANLAGEVAAGKFCESTIGCKNPQTGQMLKNLMQTDYFRIAVVEDIPTIEICGALKNIVAVAAGIVDGLELGDNSKAAVMRIGLMEMINYAKTFYPESQLTTFFESCGVADLITTCYGGRNRKIAEAFVRTGKSMEQLEKEMLNGQRMQGPQTAEEVYLMLSTKGLLEKFPLLVAVHRICIGELPATRLIDCVRSKL